MAAPTTQNLIHCSSRRLGRFWLAVAPLVVVAQLCSLLHVAFVPHFTCEHGESVHHSEILSTPAASTAALRSEMATVADALEHEHCLIQAQRRNQTVRDAQITCAWASSFSLGTLFDVENAGVLSTLPLLSVAPKQSPPVQA